MKLILHIGQSKTGTTAIQTFLKANRKKLIEQKFLYPDYYISGMPLNTLNHNCFAEELSGLTRRPGFSSDEYMQQFRAELKANECNTLILSAESFLGTPQVWRLQEGKEFWEAHSEKIKTLKNLTSDFDIKLIAYFKSPEDWFETTVSQVIRYAGLFGKNVYENDEQLFSLLKPHLDYPKHLTLWKETLNPAQMMVMPYERKQLVQHDIINDFCDKLDIDLRALEHSETITHSSLDRRYVEVKKILNDTPHSKTEERTINACLDRLNSKLTRIQTYRIDAGLREKVEDYCSFVHSWMNEHYAKDSANFFTIEDKAITKPDSLSKEEIAKAMHDFKRMYNAPSMRIFRLKEVTKYYLRKKQPKIYAFIKNILPR